jgi:hypothetical protein
MATLIDPQWSRESPRAESLSPRRRNAISAALAGLLCPSADTASDVNVLADRRPFVDTMCALSTLPQQAEPASSSLQLGTVHKANIVISPCTCIIHKRPISSWTADVQLAWKSTRSMACSFWVHSTKIINRSLVQSPVNWSIDFLLSGEHCRTKANCSADRFGAIF